MKLAKKIKKAIVVLLCTSMVMTNVLPSFAEGNNESEPAIEEVVENEAEEAIEEIVEDEPEENSEDIEEELEESPEAEDEVYEEEPEEVEEVASPSEIIDGDSEENDRIPADMVEEPEEDEVVDEPEEEPMLLGSIASPSDTEEVEESETEEEIEEATPSELGMPMLLGAPLFGDPPANECKIGSTEYATLQEALTVVTSGQTITILKDLTYNNSAPGFSIMGGFTIDFNGHSLTVATGSSAPTVTNIFSVGGPPENLTIKNATINITGMMYSGTIKPFTVSGDGVKLTLTNIIQANNLSNFLTIDNGGIAIIDGGTFGTNNTTTKICLANNATLKLTNNPIFNLQGDLINIGGTTYTEATSNTDADTLMGNVIIDNGDFIGSNTIGIIALYGKANVTINGGTFTSSSANSAPIFIGNAGYKSNLTINNLTSDSPYVFGSNNNSNIESFTANVNNGHYKYTKGKFAIDRSNGLKPNIKLNGGFYGPDTEDVDALNELNGFCASGKTAEALSSSDSEYANGYRYKIYSNTPSPSPSSSGGGSSGGGGGGGSPKYDSLGNIIGPSGIQSYGYDGTNPPNLSGNITVSQWDYNTSNSHVADIHYVQNIDSFVRGNNTPVIAEWIGITTNTNSKVLWYRTNANGQILRNQFIQIGNNIYYFDNNGIMKTGQFTINGVTYNFETTVGATEGRLLY